MSITFDAARELATERIAQIPSEYEIVILDDHIVDTDSAWFFPYNGKDYVENGNFAAALAGNHPVRVSKIDGSVSLAMPPG